MDEQAVETTVPTVGERLKAARTKKKMSLEDIAAQTRIPLRHLQSVEESAWDRLPAPTYTMGFAKSYAGAVGLDRAEIGDQLREELGGHRYPTASTETFEPADPARTMPKWLVIGAILAVLLIVLLLTWLNNRALDSGDAAAVNAAVETPAPTPAPAQQPVAQGPVVLSVAEPVWLQVYEKGGSSYFSGILNPGQNFTVPREARAPLLKTAKAEGLRIMVGTAVAPPVGPPATLVSDVSLLPADLMRAGSAPTSAAPAAASAPSPAVSAPRPAAPTRRTVQRPAAVEPPPPPTPAPTAEPQANSGA